MRRLVPILVPLAAFAAAAIIATPGMAGGKAHTAQTPTAATCVPAPACLPLSSTDATPVLCCWKVDYEGKGNVRGRRVHGAQTGDCCDVDTLTAALDEPLADAGDELDDYLKGWSSCVINNGFIYAFNIYDSALGQNDPDAWPEKAHAAQTPAPNPIVTENTACLAKAATHHGTTWYKHYGKPRVLTSNPLFAVTYAYHGHYGHKYDHEMTIRHCGGLNDDDCWEEVLLRNKSGGGLHAYNYCSGLGSQGSGFCPNASYINVQVGVPWCKIGASNHPGKVRNDCWYVY